jgi:site-specific DNA-methyltransferase (adenine-specific)
MPPTITLHHGDCLDFARSLPSGAYDAIVSDPPYGMKWDTNCRRFSGGEAHHRKSAPGRDWREPIDGDGDPFDPSPWLVCPRVVLWGSNHYAARLPVGTTLVWVKRNEPAYGSFLSDAETAWMKGGHGVYLHKDLSMNGLARRRVHPSQKPVGLMKWCIGKLKLKAGATVFDPYMGSGSTLVAALQMGFNVIGCDTHAGHFAEAERRVNAEACVPTLF